jgi:hypothetical protein
MGNDAMYRFAVLSLVFALTNSNAVGAIVRFSPESAALSGIDTRATFEVTIIPEVEGGFDTADLLFGSEDGLRMLDFEYSDDWYAAFVIASRPTHDWLGNLWISGNSPTLNDVPSLFAGILTVDATGLEMGEYYFGVNSGVDGFSSLGQQGVPDFAYGGAVVYAGVPEPATLGLLALASLAVLRRPGRQE